jgi:hypothetical protein
MNKKIILAFISLLIISSVSAALVIDVKPIRNSIYMDEMARFSVSISNPDRIEKTLQMYSTDVEFNSEMEPFISKIGPNKIVNFELRLLPSSYADQGSFLVNVAVESSNTNERFSLQIPVYIKTFDTIEKQYNPSVELKVNVSNEFDPRQDIPISIYLRNRNKLNIEKLDIEIVSSLFSEFRTVPLSPYPDGERRENILLRIDKVTPPQEDNIEVMIRIGNRTINNERIPYKVLAYSNFVSKSEESNELFKTTTEYTIVNDGNMQKKDFFKADTSFIRRMFTSATPSFETINLKKGGYLEWTLDLAPMQEVKITVVENYRPLIYFILIGIVIIMIYFLYRSPIVAKKEALVTKT